MIDSLATPFKSRLRTKTPLGQFETKDVATRSKPIAYAVAVLIATTFGTGGLHAIADKPASSNKANASSDGLADFEMIETPVPEAAARPMIAINAKDDCGCRQIPGGYPCRGGCRPCITAVDCADRCGLEGRWADARPMRFDAYGQGGYAGPSRLAHLGEYRLRPGDEIQVVYLITRRQRSGAYRLTPGDEVLIESLVEPDLTRGTLENGLQIQPDGTISVRLLGQVQAAGLTVAALRESLNEQYLEFYREPSIDVTPVKVNTLAEDIRNAIGGQSGFNQQTITVVVMPDGKIRLPGLGEICVQGFSLSQLKREINLRYEEIVVGIDVEPLLAAQAPHFVSVLGQVTTPGRFEMTAPTTVLSALAQAGGHLPGGNMRQVVIFRRAEDWRMISTMLDLQGAVLGKRPTPADEIWLRDGDVVIVPDKPINRFNQWASQVFTEGLYAIIPIQVNDF